MRYSNRLMRALVAGAVCVLADAAQGQERDSVWVNTRSGVYHCPGTEYFGRTSQGEYLTETVARERGHRPNGGRRCAVAMPVADSLAPPPVMPQGLETTCVVEQITDGDTIICQGIGSIRPIGMDAPELSQEPFGTAATGAMASHLPVGSTIQLEFDSDRRDDQNRLLAYVWFRGDMINWMLVRKGWAVALPFPETSRYAVAFEAAERAAEREQRGLWYVDGFRCRPRDRRRNICE